MRILAYTWEKLYNGVCSNRDLLGGVAQQGNVCENGLDIQIIGSQAFGTNMGGF